MTNKEVFKIWAPVGAKWVDWVRPVPFINLDKDTNCEYCHFDIPQIQYIDKLLKDTAIFIDLPSYEAILESISLAKIGYRPIPIYNGTNEQVGAMATVSNHGIEYALRWGALELEKIKLGNDAPPAFLLDTNRMHRLKMNISVFDNSWDIYPQDVPSALYFKNNGIDKIIVHSEKIQNDLSQILYKYQQANIKILFTNGYEEPKEINLKKPRSKDRGQ